MRDAVKSMMWTLVWIAMVALPGCASHLGLSANARVAVEGADSLHPSAVASLRFLDAKSLAPGDDELLKNFGGISGADRDPASGLWYLISDDRSEQAPARFYTADIEIGERGFGDIRIRKQASLLQPGGAPYPSARMGGEIPDAEAIRIDPRNGDLYWSSEGDRRLGLNPFIKRADRNGHYAGQLPLPSNLMVSKHREIGSRNNASIEGLAFSPDGNALWIAMETALYQDGPVASVQAGAPARFTKVSRTGTVLGQYVYPVDPIPIQPTGGQKRADNGVSEILAITDHSFLVVERSGYEVGENDFRFAVRIYAANVEGATDVSRRNSIKDAPYAPIAKRLLLDLTRLNLGHLDNIEAAGWGPRLANGHLTLVLISDNNFSPRQINQFLLFEVLEQ